ncbi:hypothetical protein ACFL2I_04305 [Candidatus Omnitrophota bacterium]
MGKRRAVTVMELMIAVAIIAILAGMSLTLYFRSTERAKSAEALININAISQAEQAHNIQTGDYAAADDIGEINELFGLGIVPKFYEYQVLLPDEESFVVVAKRIGVDFDEFLDAGELPPAPMLIAMGQDGLIDSGLGKYIGHGLGGGAGTTDTGYSGSSGGSVITTAPGGGISSTGSGGGGGTGATGSSGGGGTSGDSGSPGGGGDTGGTDSPDGGGSGGGTTAHTTVYDTTISGALNLLQGSATGAYYYDLIQAQDITVAFEDFFQYGYDTNVNAFWVSKYNDPADVAAAGLEFDKIYLNQWLQSRMPEAAIAALITHEATHADYDYYPDKWIASTLAANPTLTVDDLHIDQSPNNSIDQETNAHINQVNVWKETKGSNIDMQHDYIEAIYDQSESLLWLYVAITYSGQGLPNY